jgi:hypothetical protein
MPVSVGSPLSNCRNASNPPADAPIPATGNFAAVPLSSCLRAGVALTAPRFGTTRSVLGDIVGGVIRKKWQVKFAHTPEGNHKESGVFKVVQSR